MNLYLISITATGYDMFDSAVVCAPSSKVARNMNPGTGQPITKENWKHGLSGAWCRSPKQVTVERLGKAAAGISQGVVCSSFNAG